MKTQFRAVVGVLVIVAVLIASSRAPASAQEAELAYVTNLYSNSVSVLDTMTGLITAVISDVGNWPRGIAVAPDGGRVYVTRGGEFASIEVIDTATNVIVTSIATGQGLHRIAISPDGCFAYATHQQTPGSISVFDLITNSKIGSLPAGDHPTDLVVTPDGREIYVANTNESTVSVVDIATATILASVPVGYRPFSIAISPDGSVVYAGSTGSHSLDVIDTETWQVVATLTEGLEPRAIVFSPDGTRAYSANGDFNTVSVIDTATHTVVAALATGIFPTGVAVTRDSQRVVVANFDSNTLSIIDSGSNTIVSTIPTAPQPLGVAIRPAVPLPSPEAGVQSLVGMVDQLELSGDLTHGRATQLKAKLDQALRALRQVPANTSRAQDRLLKFISDVQKMIPQHLAPEMGQPLIEEATSILDQLKATS